MSRDSHFTYPRSVTDDIAVALAHSRSHCWCQPQLIILDQTIDTICDDLTEHDPHFDTERFRTRARYWTDRARVHLPTKGTS